MAGLKFWKTKVAASSLIETITAMVIISMVFGLAIVIYLNIYKSNGQLSKLEGALAIQDAWAETQRSNDFSVHTWSYDDFAVYREMVPASDTKNLITVTFEVRNQEGKLMAERKFLKYVAH